MPRSSTGHVGLGLVSIPCSPNLVSFIKDRNLETGGTVPCFKLKQANELIASNAIITFVVQVKILRSCQWLQWL